MRVRDWLIFGAAIVLIVAMSYGLALLKEPSAYWLWHNVLRVIP